MPVEITMPLTPLEQAVADARKHEQVMAAKVEDAKLVLKSAKTAWEEAVGEVFRAIDEMIADKRQPSLPFDVDDGQAGNGETGPNEPPPSSPGGNPVAEPAVVTVLVPTQMEIVAPTVHDAPANLLALPSAAEPKGWRPLIIAEHLDGPATLFDGLATFGVETLGELADALKAGRTFNLPRDQVHELYEAIEDVSAADAEPITFDRDAELPLTVKEPPPAVEEPVAKPAKKGRAKKAKEPTEPVESEPSAAPASGIDDL